MGSESARRIDGEQFLGQFNLMSLSEDDVREMWRRYDRDDSGSIDPSELRWMLEDVQEQYAGHRHVSDTVFGLCFKEIDLNADGIIQFEEFERYIRTWDFSMDNLRR